MPDVQAAWRFLESSDPVASAQEVQAAIRRLAGEIESARRALPARARGHGRRRFSPGRSCRSCVFLWISTTSMPRATAQPRAAPRSSGACVRRTSKGRAVLVLDDILDHGETMAAIRVGLLQPRRACIARCW